MNIKKYLKDKLIDLIIILVTYIIILLMLLVFKTSHNLIIATTFIFFLMTIMLVLIDFFRKKKFYDEFLNNLNRLDKKYLILETLTKPNFLEGELLYHSLYEIDKSMIENIKIIEKEVNDFKDYIEMWIHEVKIPISSLTLLCHNHKNILSKNYFAQVKKLDNYIDQVLYYVRSNYTEKDFAIRKISLDKIISEVLLKNKDDLLENSIDIEVNLDEKNIYSDQKWLIFIINQIINNSIKYKDNKKKSIIKITSKKCHDKVILSIYDNGIGIDKEDIPQVFKKSFTGNNGRDSIKSTGMGLYIANKLCEKLGHILEINSKKGEYTELIINFGSNNLYDFND